MTNTVTVEQAGSEWKEIEKLEMIEFNTTIGTGNAIEAVGAKTLTTTHFIKVTLAGGLIRYIPLETMT